MDCDQEACFQSHAAPVSLSDASRIVEDLEGDQRIKTSLFRNAPVTCSNVAPSELPN